MFLKINKELMPVDPRSVVCLGKNWEDSIPKRPDTSNDDEEEPSGDELESESESENEMNQEIHIHDTSDFE